MRNALKFAEFHGTIEWRQGSNLRIRDEASRTVPSATGLAPSSCFIAGHNVRDNVGFGRSGVDFEAASQDAADRVGSGGSGSPESRFSLLFVFFLRFQAFITRI